MEVFTIDGWKAGEMKKNNEMLIYLGPEERGIIKEKMNRYSPFRLRRKTITNVIILNVMRRKRMLELISGIGGGIILN